jgi:phosphopantetheine--protein transferase-like protein
MIGIDMVSVARIQRILLSVDNNLFVNKVLSLMERHRFYSSDVEMMPRLLAEFFAVKEAVVKASICPFPLTELYRINVTFNVAGRMTVAIHPKLGKFCVSTDLFGEYVIAVAITCNSHDELSSISII